jgi:tetratricopeptide (TPR) repeat protein
LLFFLILHDSRGEKAQMKKISLYTLIMIITLSLTPSLAIGQQTDLESKVKINQVNPEAKKLLNEGITKYKNSDYDGALIDFKDLTKLYPEISEGYYNLGLAYSKKNMLKEATKSWEQTVQMDKNNADAYYNLAIAYRIMKDNKQTLDAFTKYLMLRPNSTKKQEIAKIMSELREPYIGNGIIGRIYLTDDVDLKERKPKNVKNVFKTATKNIFTSIETISAPQNTKLEAKWYFISFNNEKVPVNSIKVTATGSSNILIALTKPKINWPVGKYELQILVNGQKNTSVIFNMIN